MKELQRTTIDGVAPALKDSFNCLEFNYTLLNYVGRVDGIVFVVDATEPKLKSAKAIYKVRSHKKTLLYI